MRKGARQKGTWAGTIDRGGDENFFQINFPGDPVGTLGTW